MRPSWESFPMKRQRTILLGLSALVLVGIIGLSAITVPAGNAGSSSVDVLLVLGSPSTMEGGLSRQQRWRVDAAVKEYQAGRAPRLMMSGGAAGNEYVEAKSMAQEAVRLGVPRGDVLEEGESRTTMDNIANAQQMLLAHGWKRVEVVTSPDHARRVAVLLNRSGLTWRVFAAPTPGRNPLEKALAYAQEAVATTLLRWFGPKAELFIHAVARVLQGMEHWVRQRAWQVHHRAWRWHPDSKASIVD